MFFTPELLARRDSGFGLLWLAATLGSKSTFKKLPKRSVLTADIAQLCNLIVQPNEPLALRLSSNLMIGVARIYKVKQEIFFSDVSTCVASLKKAVYELQALSDAQLQMAQPTLRSAAVTLAPDPKNAFMMEFDMLVADWDEYLDLHGPARSRGLVDEGSDYDPIPGRKSIAKVRRRQVTEAGNVNAHTLVEHYEHVLSASFDLGSVNRTENQGFAINPSSGIEDFRFTDFFPMSDGPAVGDMLGDELARELGWESPALYDERGQIATLPEPHFDYHQLENEPVNQAYLDANISGNYNGPISTVQVEQQRDGLASCDGVSPSGVSPMGDEPRPTQLLGDITNKGRVGKAEVTIARPRPKRSRVLLDVRTELTDDELKNARIQYIQSQAIRRRENRNGRLEQERNNLARARIFGAPVGIVAPVLADFWQSNLKTHIDAKSNSGLTQEDILDRPRKRRRLTENTKKRTEDLDMLPIQSVHIEDPDFGDQVYDPELQAPEMAPYRSSEEPGQGRYASRPPSALGSNFGLEIGLHEDISKTQQSFMFPWDNAGPSSTSGGAPFRMSSSNQFVVEQADVRLRGSSRSRRESPLSLDHMVADDFSPAPFGRGSQGPGEDYQFDVKSSARKSTLAEPRREELNALSLERNSLNFLEYAKMQFNTLPNSAQELSFDTIAPKATSTRHVAAAAFYHCLVLGTKDLLRLNQVEPYGPITVSIAK